WIRTFIVRRAAPGMKFWRLCRPCKLSSSRNPATITCHFSVMKRYSEQAKISKDKRHFHVLKHSIATHLLDADSDLMFVKDWLGHARVENTLIYTKLVPTTRDERARHLFPKLPRLS